jgi:hypothetical protein
MRMSIAIAVCAAALSVTPAAFTHPSENRNPNGFGGGPHCHIVVVAPTDPAAYPSHTGHVHAGNDIFNADPDC